jgi:hypothetical protein
MPANPESATASTNRKAYNAPDVVEYGSLADITLALGTKGQPDGGVSLIKTRL